MIQNNSLPQPLTKVLLAPLAGISSLDYRLLNRRFGCKFACLEMISARSLSYQSKKTLEMMKTNQEDRPLGLQLLGENPKYILKALEYLDEYPFDILDFNAACPIKKVTNHGKGAALLKEPKKLSSLLKLMVKNSSKPVTLKMRLGWDSPKDAVETAQMAEDSGISALCVHGRTRFQKYQLPLDYESIKKIKKSISIPLIASGEIWGGQTAKKMFEETGCDAITVARGSLGNPWIFKEIESFLDRGDIIARPKIEEISQAIKTHMDLMIEHQGEKNAIIKFRKFFIWYTKGLRNIKPLRAEASLARKRQDIIYLNEKLIAQAADSS
ncbi:MAG: tRNA dihydrouridine synthase DusB [Candidatus Omnitrophica bacterium]|nr:tRNA dihydrouridine synthase DusB [Candidatus Omnitrophota bacterium]